VPELGRAAIELARAALSELGADAPLAEVERILREGGGADLQRRAFAEGGMPELLRRLVADTAP
jgi:hypothetical protein